MEERKYCIVCKGEIYRGSATGTRNKSSKTRRGKHQVTCSRPCAKIFQRVAHHIKTHTIKMIIELEGGLKHGRKTKRNS